MSRLEEIEDLINRYTSDYLLEKNYEFQNNNAKSVSLILKADRSNVSRILNELASSQKLIRIKGRPVTYLSRSALKREFPQYVFPDTFSSLEDLHSFLHGKKKKKKDDQVIPFIGTQPGESLHSTIQQFTWFLEYQRHDPSGSVRFYLVSGQSGTGKKTLVQRLASSVYGISASHFYTFVYNGDISFITQTIVDNKLWERISIFIIQIYSEYADDAFKSLCRTIESLYQINGQPVPILFFLIDDDNLDLSYLRKNCIYHCKLPPLNQRSANEKKMLVYSFFQDAQKVLKRDFKISNHLIQLLADQDYEYNCSQLKATILQLVSQSETSNHDASVPLYIYNQQDRTEDIRWISVTSKGIMQPQVSQEQDSQHPPEESGYKAKFRNILFQNNFFIEPGNAKNKISSVYSQAQTVLSDTTMIHDPMLLDNVCTFLSEIADDPSLMWHIDSPDILIPKTDKDRRIISSILRAIRHTAHRALIQDEQDFIATFILTALACTRKVKVPVLIASTNNKAAQNYCSFLNRSCNARMFFSLDTSFDKYYINGPGVRFERKYSNLADKITGIMTDLDHGYGIFFVTDIPLLDTADSYISRTSRISVGFLHHLRLSRLLYYMQDIATKPKKPNSPSLLTFQTHFENSLFDKRQCLSSEARQILIKIFPQMNVNDILPRFQQLFSLLYPDNNNPADMLDFIFHGLCAVSNNTGWKEYLLPFPNNAYTPLKKAELIEEFDEALDILPGMKGFVFTTEDKLILMKY